MYEMPNKEVPSKIGSMELLSHKPGGGTRKILDEKPKWKKIARTEHFAKEYKPGG
jgi:hypothetical protein